MAEGPASSNNLVESREEGGAVWRAEARDYGVAEPQAAACLFRIRNTCSDPEVGHQIVRDSSSCRCTSACSWSGLSSGRIGRGLGSSRNDSGLDGGDRNACKSSGSLVGLVGLALAAVTSRLGFSRSESWGSKGRCGERSES